MAWSYCFLLIDYCNKKVDRTQMRLERKWIIAPYITLYVNKFKVHIFFSICITKSLHVALSNERCLQQRWNLIIHNFSLHLMNPKRLSLKFPWRLSLFHHGWGFLGVTPATGAWGGVWSIIYERPSTSNISDSFQHDARVARSCDSLVNIEAPYFVYELTY